MPARKPWCAILDVQIETGTPFICYKDAADGTLAERFVVAEGTHVFAEKLNQQNLGATKSPNLCTEIMEHSAPPETAVCSLALLAPPTFVRRGKFDFEKHHEVAKVVTFNLNRVIDVNYYPAEEARYLNMHHRPIGTGVQGLTGTFMMLRLPFDPEEAHLLNLRMFEAVYHAAVETSSEIAAADGPYSTYQGSPASQGKLRCNLWDVTPIDL